MSTKIVNEKTFTCKVCSIEFVYTVDEEEIYAEAEMPLPHLCRKHRPVEVRLPKPRRPQRQPNREQRHVR